MPARGTKREDVGVAAVRSTASAPAELLAARGELLLEAVSKLPLRTIGRSREGRPILATKQVVPTAGPGGRAPNLLVFGGIHGDEPQSVSAVADLIATGGPDRPEAGGAAVWFIPALNPDGIARQQKNGSADVDLNRNFAARNFTIKHRPGYAPGPYALSEPETSLLADLVEREQIGAVVAVHAPLACVNWDGPAESWAAAVAHASGWPAQADLGYPTPGSLGSWLGVDRGFPVLTIELPPGPYEDHRTAALSALRTAIAWHLGWRADPV